MFCVTLHLRTNMTERALAALFGVGDATVHRMLATYTPHVAAILPAVPKARRSEVHVVDGTLIPVHDRSMTAKSRNYRRSVNVQVVAQRSTRAVVAVSDPVPGSRHDVRAYKESGLADHLQGVPLIGDGGYRGAPGVVSPARDSHNRIVHDDGYDEFARQRATAEHVLARVKDWQTMRQNRKRGQRVTDAIRACAVLYNMSDSVTQTV